MKIRVNIVQGLRQSVGVVTPEAVATCAEIYSRNDEAKLTDVSCSGHVDVR